MTLSHTVRAAMQLAAYNEGQVESALDFKAPPDLSQIVKVAEAMRAKRKELTAQPLDRIWSQLAQTAIEAMES